MPFFMLIDLRLHGFCREFLFGMQSYNFLDCHQKIFENIDATI